MMAAGCPNVAEHTPCPPTYLGWHDWAEEKSKTHRQVRCKGRGLFAIWVPKRRAASQRAEV